MGAQVDACQIVHDHWLRGQLAQEEVLVLTALPQELVLDLHVEVRLNGIHEQSWVLRGCSNDFFQDLLALQVVYFAVPKELLLRGLAEAHHRVHHRQHFESGEEEANEGLVEDVLLLGELASEKGVGEEDQVVLEGLLIGSDEVVELPQALLQLCLLPLARVLLVIGERLWR